MPVNYTSQYSYGKEITKRTKELLLKWCLKRSGLHDGLPPSRFSRPLLTTTHYARKSKVHVIRNQNVISYFMTKLREEFRILQLSLQIADLRNIHSIVLVVKMK